METEMFLIHAIQGISPELGAAPMFEYQQSGRLKGFATREEAQEYLNSMDRKPGYLYKVVYGREYTNRMDDGTGNFRFSTFAELKQKDA